MNNNKIMVRKFTRIRQRRLRRKYVQLMYLNVIIIFIFLMVFMVMTSQKNKIEDGIKRAEYDNKHVAVIPPATVVPEELDLKEVRNLTEEEKYMLAKIAMAEAEGESLEAKMYVIMVILNRVESNDFPNSIKEVIFQKSKNVYQFTPVQEGGRWWATEPNEECYEAVEIVNNTLDDISNGALYFESCKGASWHSRNLEFICMIDNTRFYK